MNVTESGNVTLVKSGLYENADLPTVSTPSLTTTLTRSGQARKAFSPIAFTGCPSSVIGVVSSPA